MSEKKVHSGQTTENPSERAGLWSIDPELGLLRDEDGVETRLEPRLAKLMFLLLEHAGKLVSRRELVDNMWPDSNVTEQSLTRAVADLRKFLRENYSVPPVIETASKQGYRLTYPMQAQPSTANRYLAAVKAVALAIGGLLLLVLVVRGLNY